MAHQITEPTWPGVLTTLIAGSDLSAVAAAWAVEQVMSGSATPAQVGAFLVALQAKGPSATEVGAAAEVMRSHALPIDVPGPTLDVVGTGGDGSGSVNFSTMAAVVAVACGARVVKHGNRAASSRAGTADVLEELGVAIDLLPADIATCVAQAGIGFAFAQVLHPAMRHAGPIRRELAVPTIFNILGPLTNPARPTAGLIGCADARLAPVMADVFAARGDRVLVVRGGDGWDEITPHAPTEVWDTTSGLGVERTVLDPADLAMTGIHPGDLAGGDAVANAEVCRAVFGLPRRHPDLDLPSDPVAVAAVVAANAAGALAADQAARAQASGAVVHGSVTERVRAHLPAATDAIASGAAGAVLERWIAVSGGLRDSDP